MLRTVGVGVKMRVLLVFVVMLVIRVVVRMLVLRAIGVSVLMGVFVALHKNPTSPSGEHGPARFSPQKRVEKALETSNRVRCPL